MKGEGMALLDRIANYFMEWDGIDETAPKMELSIHDLRYIANMNVERCRLIRQLNEANLKTEEIRNKAIDEFAKQLKSDEFQKYNLDMVFETSRDLSYSRCINAFHEYVDEIAEQMKGGGNNE